MIELQQLRDHARAKADHVFPLQDGRKCLAGDLTGGVCNYVAVYLPGKPWAESLPEAWQKFVPRLSDLTHKANPETAFTGAQIADALDRMLAGTAPEDAAEWLANQTG